MDTERNTVLLYWIVKGIIYDLVQDQKVFKRCPTYMIDSLTYALLDVYKGFEAFAWNQHEWSEKIRFVFDEWIVTR